MTAGHGLRVAAIALAVLAPVGAAAQPIPADYQNVLAVLGRAGDYKDHVLKVNIPRGDLRVTIRQRPVPTPFGFGGWVSFTKAADGSNVMMGELVLTEDEVNPVMSAVLTAGLQVTALHNHFFWEQPRVFYMHVHGMGQAGEIAAKLKPALDLLKPSMQRAGETAAAMPPATAQLDGAAIARIVGHTGEQNGQVYKITIGRPDIDLRDHGAAINARMGLNTWAAFTGTPADAIVAGDVAMLESEVDGVLRVLREHRIDVVAIHHHMTGVAPMVVFLHYYGAGPADRLAAAVRAAVDRLGTPRPVAGTSAPVVFICQKGAAKSLIAAAYFNKMAAERGMGERAAFRALTPQEAVSSSVVEGLKADGVAIPDGTPAAIAPDDIAGATHVFALGCELPNAAAGKGVSWTDIPSDRRYGPMRDAIVSRVSALLDQIHGRPR